MPATSNADTPGDVVQHHHQRQYRTPDAALEGCAERRAALGCGDVRLYAGDSAGRRSRSGQRAVRRQLRRQCDSECFHRSRRRWRRSARAISSKQIAAMPQFAILSDADRERWRPTRVRSRSPTPTRLARRRKRPPKAMEARQPPNATVEAPNATEEVGPTSVTVSGKISNGTAARYRSELTSS